MAKQELLECTPRALIEHVSRTKTPKTVNATTEKNNGKLNQAMDINKKIILSEKKNLQEDEKNYCRKNIKYKLLAYLGAQPVELTGFIKIRVQQQAGELDLLNLKNNIAASSTHADDASIIIKTTSFLSKLSIPHSVIHDSIGAPLELSSIIKFIFKNECAEYQEHVLKNEIFPFNLFNETFADPEIESLRKKFMTTLNTNRIVTLRNLQKLKQEIVASQNLFS